MDIPALHSSLDNDALALAPLTLSDRAGLAAACAADETIWQLYPVDYGPAGFDNSFDALLGNPARLPFAVRVDSAIVGMTAYLRLDPSAQTLEIGNSYLIPALRGSGLNGRMKRLLINHAFACGVRRIEFRVDARNGRSQAAVRKLGASQEGVLRAERVTWTGHVRDTVLFGLLEADWRAALSAAAST